MTDDSKGQWPAGKSGNAAGRPKKKEPKVLATPADLYEIVMRVANRPMIVKFEGYEEKVSAYEANVMGMAAGPGPTRLARKAFVNQVNSAAWRLELDRKHAK